MYRLLLLRLYLTVAALNMSNTVSSQMNYAEKCAYILDVLTSHEYSWPFLEPVDPVALNIPTYFDLVKSPMDLRTMRSKLEQNLYTNPSNFRNDMILMFENAIVFNKDDSRDNSVRYVFSVPNGLDLGVFIVLWRKSFCKSVWIFMITYSKSPE